MRVDDGVPIYYYLAEFQVRISDEHENEDTSSITKMLSDGITC